MPTEIPPARCCRGKTVALWVCALVLVGAGGAWGWANYLQTYHFATVQDGVLYRDGNRGIREFETALRKSRAKTVVCLIDDREMADPRKPQFAREADLCKQQGVNFVRIPIKLGGWPTTDDVRKFLTIAQDPKTHPVLVHCAQGVRRTGMMVAAFEESILNWDQNKTRSSLRTFGHSDRTVKDVERFISVYDPKAKTMTAQLEQSSEE
jgi:protein tyrosine phosphatase (PTP) superfamily phosphohydrolase (DUF442 family)